MGATNTLAGGDTPADGNTDGNTANNNQRYGIYLQTANNNTVRSNTAIGNFFGGIRLQSISTNNLVSDNQVYKNGLSPCCRPGINPAGVGDVNNAILNNDVDGNGIGIQVPGFTTVAGNQVYQNKKDGILIGGQFNIVDGNEVYDNTTITVGSRAGINLLSATNNNIVNNIIRNNGHFGIELRNGNTFNTFTGNTFNLFRGNTIRDNTAGGIVFTAGPLDHDNTLYDNLLVNSLNIGAGPTTGPNTWSNPAGPTLGINIIGGPFIAGNLYAKTDGTGFSQTCADVGGDGICDSPFLISIENVDQFPLTESDGIDPAVDGRIVADATLCTVGRFVIASGLCDESLIYSDNFTDQHLGGTVFGSIIATGGLVPTVAAAPAGGLLIGVEGTVKGTATFIACGTKFTLTTGKLVNLKGCGSLIIEVIVGPVAVLNSSGSTTVDMSTGTTATVTETFATGELTLQLDDSTVVLVPSGTDATVTEFADGSFQIIKDSPEGTPPITIQIDANVGPGQFHLPIAIDIKPGSDPNSIILGSNGVISIAILTTSVIAGDLVDFDATTVDQSTLTLAVCTYGVQGLELCKRTRIMSVSVILNNWLQKSSVGSH